MTAPPGSGQAAPPSDDASAYLHPGSTVQEGVRPPLLVGSTAFKVLWSALGVLVAGLIVLAAAVGGRLA